MISSTLFKNSGLMVSLNLTITSCFVFELRQEVLRIVLNDPTLDSGALINHLKQAGYGSELDMLLSENVYVHAGFAKPTAEYAAAIRGWRAFRERDAS